MKPKHFTSVRLAGWCATALCLFAAPQIFSQGKSPVLTVTGPGFAAQEATGLQLTIQGTDFRSGARVVISPPVASVLQSSATKQASDISVNSVTVLNGNIIIAV